MCPSLLYPIEVPDEDGNEDETGAELWELLTPALSACFLNPCPATGLALSAVNVETTANISTEGFDFPAEVRLGLELETLEPNAPWKTAPDIRRNT